MKKFIRNLLLFEIPEKEFNYFSCNKLASSRDQELLLNATALVQFVHKQRTSELAVVWV